MTGTDGTELPGDAPFIAGPLTVEDTWMDHNGHMNLAFYTMLFVRAITDAMNHFGVGEQYSAGGGGTFFGVENHVRYLRELRAGDMVDVAVHVLACDARRLHWWAEMTKQRAIRSATFEMLSVHVDQATRRVTDMPAAVRTVMNEVRARSGSLGRAAHAGHLPLACKISA